MYLLIIFCGNCKKANCVYNFESNEQTPIWWWSKDCNDFLCPQCDPTESQASSSKSNALNARVPPAFLHFDGENEDEDVKSMMKKMMRMMITKEDLTDFKNDLKQKEQIEVTCAGG